MTDLTNEQCDEIEKAVIRTQPAKFAHALIRAGRASAAAREEPGAVEALREFYEGVRDCMEDTWQCERCGHAEPWWTDTNAEALTRDACAALALAAQRRKAMSDGVRVDEDGWIAINIRSDYNFRPTPAPAPVEVADTCSPQGDDLVKRLREWGNEPVKTYAGAIRLGNRTLCEDTDAAADRIESLEQQLTNTHALLKDAMEALRAAEQDAGRYRWLRERTVHTGLSRWMKHHQFLDAAIDAARSAVQATPEGAALALSAQGEKR